jgi:hypothetical protein
MNAIQAELEISEAPVSISSVNHDDISFAAVMIEPALNRLLMSCLPNLMSIFLSLGRLPNNACRSEAFHDIS